MSPRRWRESDLPARAEEVLRVLLVEVQRNVAGLGTAGVHGEVCAAGVAGTNRAGICLFEGLILVSVPRRS